MSKTAIRMYLNSEIKARQFVDFVSGTVEGELLKREAERQAKHAEEGASAAAFGGEDIDDGDLSGPRAGMSGGGEHPDVGPVDDDFFAASPRKGDDGDGDYSGCQWADDCFN